jgi:hypothetical protein
MNELVSTGETSEFASPACGLVHPTEAFKRLTTMGLGLLTSALQHGNPLPEGLQAFSGKQWRINDTCIDVFVDLNAPLGKEIEVEDLSHHLSLVGASVPDTGQGRLTNITHFNVSPAQSGESQEAFRWEDDGAFTHSSIPPLTEDQHNRVKQIFNDLRHGEVPADKIRVIERSSIELRDDPSDKRAVFSVIADRLHADAARIILPGLIIRANFKAQGSDYRFYAAISKEGFTILDYEPPLEEDESLAADVSRCEYGQNTECALKQLAEAGGAVMPAEVLENVLALGNRALGMLAIKNI